MISSIQTLFLCDSLEPLSRRPPSPFCKFLFKDVEYSTRFIMTSPDILVKKSRWGMMPSPSIYATRDSKSTPPLQWEDFDHTQTLVLGDSTSIFYPKKNLQQRTVVSFCDKIFYTEEMSRLVEIAHAPENNSFLSTSCVFEHEDRMYVGSELSDIALADIINCNIPVREQHLSAILNQVRIPLTDVQC